MLELLAHTGHGADGLLHGLAHPLGGLDHLLAMVSVGIWATRESSRWWVLPVVFVTALLGGLMLGVTGAPLAGVELGIQGSVLAVGVLLAVGRRLPTGFAVALTALFAVFHGHAHGAEMPADTSGLMYGVGMVLATALLHLVGVGMGFALRGERALPALRLTGATIAAAGLLLLVGAL